jgi:two-component system sensor histidine kinase KdpD
MRRADDTAVWIVVGALGSMALGIALIPLRSVTSASNLAFAFIVFTIVVAELGGRGAALVTAVVSTLSLNFFLTEPYLTLNIYKTDDIVAFLALGVAGLVAAAFGRRRARWSQAAGRAGKELDVVEKLLGQLHAEAPLDEMLEELRRSFGLRAAVLRDDDQRVLAAAPADRAPSSIPKTRLTPDTLVPSDDSTLRFGTGGLRLPAEGGRLQVQGPGGPVYLDLWEGDDRGLGLDEGRTLTIGASMLALAVSRRTG